MKIGKYILLFAVLMTVFSSCSHDNEEEEKKPAKRTVLVFMCAENNLDSYGYYLPDYKDIVNASRNLSDSVNLIVFSDRSSKTEKPFIAKCDKDGVKKVKIYDEDFYCVDKEKMADVMSWVRKNYPAESYGLSFWGHGNGWIVASDTYTNTSSSAKLTSRAYGYDSGVDNTDGSKGWMLINIPELTEVISSSFPKLEFIFFDCCQMMCAEVAYELRNSCKYIIASPSEIPGCGAPYTKVVSDFFLDTDKVGPAIVDDYISSLSEKGLPLAVVNTERMQDLQQATYDALCKIMPDYQYPKELDLTGMIYYGANSYTGKCPSYYDVRCVMRKYLDDQSFQAWDDVFQKAVVYSTYPGDSKQKGLINWSTSENISFSTFSMRDDNFGGLSMFIPQLYYQYTGTGYLNPNTSIFRLSWTNVVDWSKWGWSK